MAGKGIAAKAAPTRERAAVRAPSGAIRRSSDGSEQISHAHSVEIRQTRMPIAANVAGMDVLDIPPLRRHAALRRGRISIPGHIYHVTATTLGRERHFANFAGACAAAQCFDCSSALGEARMLAWVLMPDHEHWIVQLGATETLAFVVARLKSVSARNADRALGSSGPLWSRAFHDRALRGEDDIRIVARYVVSNPVRSGLVSRVSAYPFWNAIWL